MTARSILEAEVDKSVARYQQNVLHAFAEAHDSYFDLVANGMAVFSVRGYRDFCSNYMHECGFGVQFIPGSESSYAYGDESEPASLDIEIGVPDEFTKAEPDFLLDYVTGHLRHELSHHSQSQSARKSGKYGGFIKGVQNRVARNYSATLKTGTSDSYYTDPHELMAHASVASRELNYTYHKMPLPRQISLALAAPNQEYEDDDRSLYQFKSMQTALYGRRPKEWNQFLKYVYQARAADEAKD